MSDKRGKETVLPAESGLTESGSAAAHEPSYTKAQILTFVRYAHRRDLLSALLREDRKYTHAEVVAAIQNFMEGGRA